MLEDSAAVLGVFLAAAGIVAAYLTQNPAFDAMGSIVVDLLLGFVAIHLVIENRELLMGKAVPDGVEEKFIAIMRARPSVRGVHDVKTRQLTPEAYKLKAEVIFDSDFVMQKLEKLVPPEAEPADRRERLRSVAASSIRIISEEVDAIEAAVRAEIPEVKHIDIEIDHIEQAEGGSK